MTKTFTRLLAAATLCALPATANAAVTLTIQNGKLTGASGVVIGDRSYDVSFADGTCATVYGTCETKSFQFQTATTAKAAAQALLDQVFLDGPGGNFDSSPGSIAGCSSSLCNAMIAYAADNRAFSIMAASNTDGAGDYVESGRFLLTYDSTPEVAQTFARFTPAAAVPEPATWALMLAGFGLTATALRRRRVGFARVSA